MKRRFSSLTAQEALHVAVFIEERNSEIYHRFAEMFVEFHDDESLEIASVFWEMAAEERQHSTMLQERYSEEYGGKACSLTDDDIYEFIELPRLQDSKVFLDAETGGPGARERALEVGLKAETTARNFYSELAASASDMRQRELFASLASFEGDHVAYLERKLAEAPNRGAKPS